MSGQPRDALLEEMLRESQARGFLGPGPVEQHLQHSQGFVDLAEQGLGGSPGNYLDLGTGGGVPGLFCALVWPNARGTLLDANARRCAALRSWLPRLGLDGRVVVVEGRAETHARASELREHADLVTARGFAAPAATAEIGTAFVRVGGFLIVSDPPEADASRWPPEALAELGLSGSSVEVGAGHYTVLLKENAASDAVPRGVGRPSKRPLWR